MKKKYIAPELTSVGIDKEMSLIMMSYHDQTKPPDDPFGGGGSGAPANSGQFKESNFESNPFNERK
jgi:hypothetical protein